MCTPYTTRRNAGLKSKEGRFNAFSWINLEVTELEVINMLVKIKIMLVMNDLGILQMGANCIFETQMFGEMPYGSPTDKNLFCHLLKQT